MKLKFPLLAFAVLTQQVQADEATKARLAAAEAVFNEVTANSRDAFGGALQSIVSNQLQLADAKKTVTERASRFGDFVAVSQSPSDPPSNLVVIGSLRGEKESEVQEDLQIMGRIIAKALEDQGRSADQLRAMGIVLHSLGVSSTPQQIYLENYGVLFMGTVPFPLQPKEESEGRKKEVQEPENEWEQTRRELQGGGKKSNSSTASAATTYNFFASHILPYNKERVDRLKTSLIQALKNASHMRNLTDGDQVCIVIKGADHQTQSTKVYLPTAAAPGTRVIPSTETSSVTPGGVLTIRVKKSDIDAYSKGKLSLEQFTSKVDLQLK